MKTAEKKLKGLPLIAQNIFAHYSFLMKYIISPLLRLSCPPYFHIAPYSSSLLRESIWTVHDGAVQNQPL